MNAAEEIRLNSGVEFQNIIAILCHFRDLVHTYVDVGVQALGNSSTVIP